MGCLASPFNQIRKETLLMKTASILKRFVQKKSLLICSFWQFLLTFLFHFAIVFRGWVCGKGGALETNASIQLCTTCCKLGVSFIHTPCAKCPHTIL